jgi:hypothetical protein
LIFFYFQDANAVIHHKQTKIVFNLRFFVVATLLTKPKQQHKKKPKQKHWFLYKLYGFCCCAYQNKPKIKLLLFFVYLGLALDHEPSLNDAPLYAAP